MLETTPEVNAKMIVLFKGQSCLQGKARRPSSSKGEEKEDFTLGSFFFFLPFLLFFQLIWPGHILPFFILFFLRDPVDLG